MVYSEEHLAWPIRPVPLTAEGSLLENVEAENRGWTG